MQKTVPTPPAAASTRTTTREVQLSAIEVRPLPNGRYAVILPSRTIEAHELTVLKALFPNTFHDIMRALDKEALLSAID